MMNKTFFIQTYGCQMNTAESSSVKETLYNTGWEESTEQADADLIVINTCSVRKTAENRIWGRLGYYKRLKQSSNFKLIVIGCMAERIGNKLAEHEAVDIVAGPDSYRDIPMLLDKAKTQGKGVNVELSEVETYSGITPERIQGNQISGFVNIMRGCNNFCTYCIVPYTRGRERSCNPKDIISEVQQFINLNYREITLLGQNVNSYKWIDGDNQITFPQLVEMVSQVDPTVRIRFTTSHPKDISDALIEIIAKYPNVCNHIHLPVQSGSNAVLERMNRKYTREYYLERVKKIRELIPNCGLSTDIFCGFPGETEEDFQDSLRLMQEVGYDLAFMFKYSERPGTYAAKKLPDDIDENTKKERLTKIINLQNKISKERNLAEINKTFEVLVEGYSKKSDSDLFGRTQQNKVVVFPNIGYTVGDLVLVKIVSATSATLIGEAIDK